MTTRLLRALLLERGVSIDKALKGSPAEQSVRATLPYSARLFLAAKKESTPGWVEYLNTAAASDLTDISNRGTGAALAVQPDDRTLVFTFGRGRNLIEPWAIEQGFGLRVTLNAVDADRVRAIDSRSFEDLVLTVTRQASRNAELGAFAIDDSRDVLSAVTGVPRDASLGSRISGSDGVALSTKATVDDLGDLAQRLLELHTAKDYQQRFGFIDHVRRLRSGTLTAELDQLLEATLNGGSLDGVTLAPPEVIDYEDVGGYRYTQERRGQEHQDLDIGEYLAVVGLPVTLDDLHRQRIRLISASTEEPRKTWTAYRCLVFEAVHKGQSYVLSSGQWFEVDRCFAAGVESDLRLIPIETLPWPKARPKEAEGDYNERISQTVAGTVKLDKVIFQPSGARTGFEVADLGTADGLLHVKRKTTSATLSHLFAQGRVSGEILKGDSKVRSEVAAFLTAKSHPLAARISAQPFDARAISVTYVIVASNAAKLPSALPFFSKLKSRSQQAVPRVRPRLPGQARLRRAVARARPDACSRPASC